MNRGTRITLIALPIILLGLAFYFFSDIIAYLCIAAVLSLIGRPILDLLLKIRIKRFHLPPSLAAAITLLVMISIFGMLFVLFIPQLAEQTGKLQSDLNLNDVQQGLAEPIATLEDLLLEYGLVEPGFSLETYVQDTILSILETVQVSNLAANLVGFTGSLFIGIFSIIFITFFLLKERRLLRNMIQALIPDEIEAQVDKVLVTVRNLLSRYFIGVLIEVLLVGSLIAIGLGILGVENAALIGFFAGLFNVIPYLGPIIGGIMGLALTIIGSLDLSFYDEMLPLLAKVTGVFMVVQLIDNFVFQPFIYSSSVKAHPMEVFIVILMGANLAGVGGMILAIPTYTILRVIAAEFFSQFEVVRSITSRMK